MPRILDRGLLKKSLARAERHVANVEHDVARQRMVVAGLELCGRDTNRAAHLLRYFEELQAAYLTDRDLLRKELGLTAPAENSRRRIPRPAFGRWRAKKNADG
jgi:hypothetical protein